MKQDVNYIDQINGFERWLETNYLPTGAQLLWYRMVALFNRSRWNEWITVDNRRLMSLLQVNREGTFVGWRDELLGAGLLQYVKGKKGSPNRYKMNFFPLQEAVNEAGAAFYEETAASGDAGRGDEGMALGDSGHREEGVREENAVVREGSLKESSEVNSANSSNSRTEVISEVFTDVHSEVISEVISEVFTADLLKQDVKIDKSTSLATCARRNRVDELVAYMELRGVRRRDRDTVSSLESFLEKGMAVELIRYAIDEASKKNAPWKYVLAILEDKLHAGVLSLDQLVDQVKVYSGEKQSAYAKRRDASKKASYDLDEFERTKFFMPQGEAR